MIRFRSFRASVLTLFLATVVTTQVTTYLVVAAVNQHQARAEIAAALRTAAVAFDRVTSDRIDQLARSANAVASDFAFRQNYFSFIADPATLHSLFDSASRRIGADLNAWTDLDGVTISAAPSAAPDAFADLVARADESEAARATGYSEIDGRLFAVVAVPIRAPDIVGWWIVGTRVDTDLARTLHAMTGVDVSFADTSGRIAASSLPPPLAAALGVAIAPLASNPAGVQGVDLAGDASLLTLSDVPVGDRGHLRIVLRYSLDEKLAPARRLGRLIQGVSLGGVVLAALLGLAFARRLSRPVQALAAHTRVIAAGDYAARLELDRADELGDLARSFNAMSVGLAERDQVRDLLDKNVSPAVAARLMREGAALGGEEREVTVLFADLRGFTTFAEHLPPREVVTQLNRYLDRMSQAIEAEGGVIDKFIGDEIMALFGAPVSVADSARRALRAALGMRRALEALNTEFRAEGLPALAFGIGINTARVIAGNIGSHRRLNYSVIGDGVNLAARLQSLTRQPTHATDLILSEATRAAVGPDSGHVFRDLGETTVKGRAQTVRIWTIDSPPPDGPRVEP